MEHNEGTPGGIPASLGRRLRSLTNTGWPRERVLFLLAGTTTLLSAALSAALSPLLLLMTATIGLDQLLLVATGRCPASSVVDRLLARRTA